MTDAIRLLDLDRRREALTFDGLPLNHPHNVDARHHSAERRASLPVVEPHAPVVQRGLVVQKNEEAGARRVGLVAAWHRDGPDDVFQPGDAGPFERNRLEPLGSARRVYVALDDLQQRPVGQVGLVVVCSRRAMKAAAVVKPSIDVLEEIARGDRRAFDVDDEIDVAERRLDADENFAELRVPSPLGKDDRKRQRDHEHGASIGCTT